MCGRVPCVLVAASLHTYIIPLKLGSENAELCIQGNELIILQVAIPIYVMCSHQSYDSLGRQPIPNLVQALGALVKVYSATAVCVYHLWAAGHVPCGHAGARVQGRGPSQAWDRWKNTAEPYLHQRPGATV